MHCSPTAAWVRISLPERGVFPKATTSTKISASISPRSWPTPTSPIYRQVPGALRRTRSQPIAPTCLRSAAGHLESINATSVEIARDAIDSFRSQSGNDRSCFVLGSVGPTLTGEESPDEIEGAYEQQLLTLIEGAVDALLLETFSSLEHLTGILRLLRNIPESPPVVIQMCLRQNEGEWTQDPLVFAETVGGLGAAVIGANCCTPWEASAFVDAVEGIDSVTEGRLLLSVMPNAGGFQRIGHRY